MDFEKKEKIVHYITEFSVLFIGITIFVLFWFKNFELSFNLISISVLLFNITFIFFWLCKSNYKSWEKDFVIVYFNRIYCNQIYSSLKPNYLILEL